MNYILGKIPPKYTGLQTNCISDFNTQDKNTKTLSHLEHGKVLYRPPEVQYIWQLLPISNIK
jgi:hypothetical protein